MIDSQVINIIASHSMKGETFHRTGDLFTYCLSSTASKIDGQLKFKPGRCQLKFKMRAVTTFNKLPGFPRISGYKQINPIGPSILLTNG